METWRERIYLRNNFRTENNEPIHELYFMDDRGFIEGFVGRGNEGEPVARVLDLHVQKQRQGTGSMLLKSFVAETQSEGANKLLTTSVTLPALNLGLKIFGERAVGYFDNDHLDDGFLPMTSEQAQSSFERAADYAPGDTPKLGMHVDLTKVDTAGWRRPIRHRQKED